MMLGIFLGFFNIVLGLFIAPWLILIGIFVICLELFAEYVIKPEEEKHNPSDSVKENQK